MTVLSSLRDAIAADSVSESDKDTDSAIWDGRLRAVQVIGLAEKYTLRTKWSDKIIRWIAVLITFNILLTIWVGLDDDAFKDREWFVTAVIVETFLQVVGLGYVAAKYLFSDGSD